jgi:hypothetical protein
VRRNLKILILAMVILSEAKDLPVAGFFADHLLMVPVRMTKR